MEKLQIAQNKPAIQADIERAGFVCGVLQELYTALEEKGHKPNYQIVESTVAEVLNEYRDGFTTRSEEAATEVLKNLIYENSQEGTKALGIPIRKEKLIDMIEVSPDEVETVVSIVAKLKPGDNKFFELIDFNPKSGNVELSKGYKETISELHTRYAVGERQIQVAKTLLKLRDQVNEYLSVCSGRGAGGEIAGLVFYRDHCEIEVNYIKQF